MLKRYFKAYALNTHPLTPSAREGESLESTLRKGGGTRCKPP
ncbi:hypothetical protein [Campylobacter troglodytis]|nr:hypothetical protein [Campylobacter troglodytis]